MDPPADSPIRILHVGVDEEFVRHAVATMSAERRPLEVASAADAETALGHLDGGDFDCLVCETDDVSWQSLLSAVQDHEPTPPVLVVTRTDASVDEALAAGATDVLVRRDGVDEKLLLCRRLGNLVSGIEDGDRERELAELTFTDFMLDTLEDVFYLIDLDGNFQRWNQALCDVTGYTDEEIAEMDAFDIITEDDHEAVATEIETVLDEGSTTVEVDLETRDGERVPFAITGARLTDEAGQPRGIVGIGRNITDRRELEDEIQRKASLLDHIFDQIPTALYVKDEQARHVRMSANDQDPTEKEGLTDPEIYGDTEFTRQTYEDDMRVIEEGECIINKEEYNPKNGEWTLTSKVPWRDEDGEIQGLIGVSRFITEKKEYEQDLRLRNRAIEEAPIGISILDASGSSISITYANSGFEEITGYDESSVTEQEPSMFVGPETDPEKVSALATALEEGEARSVVMVLYRADDSPFWGRITLAPVANDDGEVTHFVSFLQYVTETKEHAEEIERRLDEFADVLAEELHAPLESARSALDSAAENGAPEEITTARQSLERADKLVEDLTAVHSFSVKSRSVFESADNSSEQP